MFSLCNLRITNLQKQLFDRKRLRSDFIGLRGDKNSLSFPYEFLGEKSYDNNQTSPNQANESRQSIQTSTSPNKEEIVIIQKEEEVIKIEPIIPEPEPIIMKKYKIITSSNSLIKLPNDYSTDEQEMKELLEIINDPLSTWKKEYSDKASEIYKKKLPTNDNIMIKAITLLNYPKHIVQKAIEDCAIRKTWDTVFTDIHIVSHDDDKEVVYMFYKAPSVATDRDFVLQRKIWNDIPNNNCSMIHLHSIEHSKCPPKKGITRADLLINAYFLEEFTPNKTRVVIVTQSDIKGHLPIWLINRSIPKETRTWIENLNKGCKAYSLKKK